MSKQMMSELEYAKPLIITGSSILIAKFCSLIIFGFINYFLDGVVCFWIIQGIDGFVTLFATIVLSRGIHNLRKGITKHEKKLRASEILLLLIAPVKVGAFFISERVIDYYTVTSYSYWEWHMILVEATVSISDLVFFVIAIIVLSWGFLKIRENEHWDIKPIYSIILLVIMMVAEITYTCVESIYRSSFYLYNYDLIHAITAIIGIIVCLEIRRRAKKMENTGFEKLTPKAKRKN